MKSSESVLGILFVLRKRLVGTNFLSFRRAVGSVGWVCLLCLGFYWSTDRISTNSSLDQPYPPSLPVDQNYGHWQTKEDYLVLSETEKSAILHVSYLFYEFS